MERSDIRGCPAITGLREARRHERQPSANAPRLDLMHGHDRLGFHAAVCVRRASAGRAVACAPRLGASCARQADGRADIGDAARRVSRLTTKSIKNFAPFQEEVSMSFRMSCAAAACPILITLAPAALAQDWPNRSIVAVS